MIVEFPTGAPYSPPPSLAPPKAFRVSDKLRTHLRRKVERAKTRQERDTALRLERILTKPS